MRRIHLEDKGQDFLNFEVDETQPLLQVQNANLQGSVWNGMWVLNLFLEPGDYPQLSKSPNDEVITLKYKVESIEEIENTYTHYKPKWVDCSAADILPSYRNWDPKKYTVQEIDQELKYEKANQNRSTVIKILERFKRKVESCQE